MSDSVWPHGLQPTRLLHPWDSPGKNTGVGCHFLLQCMKVKSESEVTQSCPTLSDPMDRSLPGSFIHGIFRQQYWSGGAIAFSLCHISKKLFLPPNLYIPVQETVVSLMKWIFVKDKSSFLFFVVFDSLPTNESGEVCHDDSISVTSDLWCYYYNSLKAQKMVVNF